MVTDWRQPRVEMWPFNFCPLIADGKFLIGWGSTIYKILDAFCCAGGGRGYWSAGFEVVGVDIKHQPNYPFEFIQGDAVEFIREHGHKFDAVHASPPCQADCTLNLGTNQGKFDHPQLIPETRKALERSGRPYVIENPPGKAPMRRDLMLCGEMFGLAVIRHRNFELGGWMTASPLHPRHRGKVAGWNHGKWQDGPYFAVYGNGGGKGSVKQWQDAMGINWTTERKELAEAIPPAYTQYIGQKLIETLNRSYFKQAV